MWVSSLKSKDQACVELLQFKAKAINECRRWIWMLRSDRDDEFLSAAFSKMCEQEGITQYYTAPYTLQQNGVVEHRNWSIMEMACSLLKSKSMPGNSGVRQYGMLYICWIVCQQRLWNKSVYCSLWVFATKTPFEAWNKRKPHLVHYGCLGVLHMSSHQLHT